jgi:hypothetical protein
MPSHGGNLPRLGARREWRAPFCEALGGFRACCIAFDLRLRLDERELGSSTMRRLGIVACRLVLSAFGLMARKERQEQMAAAVAAKDQGIAACKAQYPDENKDFVARNKCGFEAAKVVRPFVTYPDLFDQSWALSAVLAEQLEARKITRAQADL